MALIPSVEDIKKGIKTGIQTVSTAVKKQQQPQKNVPFSFADASKKALGIPAVQINPDAQKLYDMNNVPSLGKLQIQKPLELKFTQDPVSQEATSIVLQPSAPVQMAQSWIKKNILPFAGEVGRAGEEINQELQGRYAGDNTLEGRGGRLTGDLIQAITGIGTAFDPSTGETPVKRLERTVVGLGTATPAGSVITGILTQPEAKPAVDYLWGENGKMTQLATAIKQSEFANSLSGETRRNFNDAVDFGTNILPFLAAGGIYKGGKKVPELVKQVGYKKLPSSPGTEVYTPREWLIKTSEIADGFKKDPRQFIMDNFGYDITTTRPGFIKNPFGEEPKPDFSIEPQKSNELSMFEPKTREIIKPEDILPVNVSEQSLRDTYLKLGQDESLPEVSKADKALSDIWQELDFAEAGKRFQTPDGEWSGVKSTFPKWIPEHLRSKELFNKLASRLEISNLSYPKRGTNLQGLYNIILDQVDARLGVDTRSIRDNILSAYEQPTNKNSIARNEDQTSRTSSGRAAGVERPGGRGKGEPISVVEPRSTATIDEAGTTLSDLFPKGDQEFEQPQLLPESAKEQQIKTKARGEKQREENLSKVSSLGEIVKQSSTNVKDKINAIDYLRTPEKVLQKIGFGKEAELLRKGYEAYVKELPRNLDKITEWSKRVPEESNEKIFKYLDGENVDLSPVEMEVTKEIQAWLKDWAKRLNLPEESTIAHYITHIFDEQLIKKEFDEDLAKIIAERLPGQVYDPFLLKRLGAKGYKQDTWTALEAYVKRGTRKVHVDPALKAIQSKAGETLEFSNIEESQWKYLKKYIDQVNMRPTEWDTILDNTFKSVFGYWAGQRPVTRFTGLFRRMSSRGLLGLNLSSALRNLSQGANTYAVLGEKYTAIGYAKLFDLKAHQELFDEGVLDSGFVTDRVLSATKKRVQMMDSVLYSFMSIGERINRGAAYFGAKAKYMKKNLPTVKTEESLAQVEKDAREYAKGIVRKTQFSFGSIDQPVAIGGDIMKTAFQLQNYTLKQTEFLGEMARDKNFIGLTRYALAGLLFVYTIGQAFNMKPEELIPSFRFGPPPAASVPLETIKAILNTPDKYGKERDMEQKIVDVSKALYGLIPASSQLKKTAGAVSALIDDGQVTNSGGKATFAIDTKSTVDVVKALLFGVYNSEGGQTYLEKLKNGVSLESIKPTYDKVQALRNEGKTEEAIALYDTLSAGDKKLYQMLKVSPTYYAIQQLKKENKIAEGIALYDQLTDKEKTAYQNLKKEEAKVSTANEDTTKEQSAEEYVKNRGEIGLVVDYAKAIYADPANAWKAFSTKEKLGIVKGNLVEMQRFYGIGFKDKGGSEEYKKALMKKQGIPLDDIDNWKLEHLTPVKAGGDTSDENLFLESTKLHDEYSRVDKAVAFAVQAGAMTRKEATEFMTDYKIKKTMTQKEALDRVLSLK